MDKVKIIVLLILLTFGLNISGQDDKFYTYQGRLEVGKNESTIIYLGEESGDLAAFCFANKSAVGRLIFSKCKNGDICKITGKFDFSKNCSIEGGMFSAKAGIVSVKSVKRVGRKK
jgi:hypothetical protein